MLGRIIIIVSLLAVSTGVCANDYPIAGLTPDRRPENAPVIRETVRPPDWEKRFFFGVAEPRPASLSWFADQSGWYTPFGRAGMTGPYDLRNWHVNEGKKR